MKRFLIAVSIVALVAPTAAPSFAQDGGGRGRGGDRGGQNFDRGQRGGGDRNFGGGDRGGRDFNRGDRGQRFGGDPNTVRPPVQQAQPRQDRGGRQQFQGGRPDRGPGQFQGRQDRGDRFQGGQRQFQGQNQFQGRRDFDRNDRRFDNGRQFNGQRFGGAQRFDNRRDFQSRRFQGPPPRGGQRFSYNGRDFYRFRSTPYVWPRGWNGGGWNGGGFNSITWALNQLLPSMFMNQNYYIDPFAYGLPFADPGYQWVQVGNDALLVDTFTGTIVDIVPGVFYW